MSKMVAIYGLFFGRDCQYVGRSINPQSRFATHNYKKTIIRGKSPKMHIFFWVPKSKASKAESEVIRFYGEFGLAQLNFHLTGRPLHRRVFNRLCGVLRPALIPAKKSNRKTK